MKKPKSLNKGIFAEYNKHWNKTAKRTFWFLRCLVFCLIIIIIPLISHNISLDDDLSRVVGKQMVASMYWEEQNVAKPSKVPIKFDPMKFTAAHKELPLGSFVRIVNPKNGKAVIVEINDRGPYVAGRDIDLSLAAGVAIDFRGIGNVFVELISLNKSNLPKMAEIQKLR